MKRRLSLVLCPFFSRLPSSCIPSDLLIVRRKRSFSCFLSRHPMSSSSLTGLEKAKQRAAYRAVDEFVSDGHVVGIGSGSTVIYAIERIAERVQKENLNLVCIPSSFQANQLIIQNNLVLGDLSRNPKIDVAIDGADEVDDALNCIKGGGGCQLQEKVVVYNAAKFVVIADYRKESKRLGEKWKKGLPIEVIPLAYVPIMNKLKEMKGRPVLRMAVNKAGPVVTDNGNFILDADFGVIENPIALEQAIKMIPGVLEVGLFCRLASVAFFGQEDGSITTKQV